MQKIKLAYIVDDDEIMIHLAELLITRSQFSEKTEMFGDAREAIHKLKDISSKKGEMPDVILFDLNMPEMDGWEFVEEYQKLNLGNNISLFVFTSSINPADEEKARTYKVIKGFIKKPLTVHTLDKILRAI
jgi:CheY-like chemotaxis protein